MPLTGRWTLTRYLIEQRRRYPQASGDLNALILDVALACKAIARIVAFGAVADAPGLGLPNGTPAGGALNVQGEVQKPLDVISNEIFVRMNEWNGHLAGMASEEMDAPAQIPPSYPRGKYLLVFDPLDGSSNIDVNVSIGTIFGVYRRRTDPSTPATEADILQPGRDLRAAGYVIYGSSTMLVYSTGPKFGVHGFTLDPTIGEFFLSHENLQVPKRGSTYSVNEGNSVRWQDSTRRWAEHLKTEDKPSGRPYGARYVGTLVADAHRTLLKGGIFAYPADKKSPSGKLRLMYEANPFAFLFEAAGGRAIDGRRRILDIEPNALHQRTPLILGSAQDVDDFERFAAEGA